MKIWIDLTDFLNWRGNLTGIQRVQYNISKLYLDSDKDVHFFVYNELRRAFLEVEFNPEEIIKAGVVVGGVTDPKVFLRRINQILRKIIRKSGAKPPRARTCIFEKDDTVLIMGGVWLGTFIEDLEECKRKKKFKLIHFAFDMIPSIFPGYVVDWLPEAFTNYQKKVFSIAEGILAISESTANDVKNFMKLHEIHNPVKIEVVRIGEEINTDKRGAERPLKELTGEDFILSVSTVEARKNHAALFYVMKEAERRSIKLPKIVIVGRNGWHTENFLYIMKHDDDASQRMLILNEIDDGQLSWLYKNCLFTIFPSFYEGWGMPIAESLAYGKLCLSSNTSSMPEIAGDMIDYFSPYNTGEILDCIIKYLEPNELNEKEDRIRREYRQTSWKNMYTYIDNFIQTINKAG